LRPLLNLAGRLSVAGISEADVYVAFAARIHQQLPDSVRSSNLGNGFNQFERKKPARASGELQHSTPWSPQPRERVISFVAGVCIHAFKLSRGNSTKKARLYFLSSRNTRIISFPPFFLYIGSHRGSQKRSGRTQGRSKKGCISDKNGVAVT
jgi:hypothetical protein